MNVPEIEQEITDMLSMSFRLNQVPHRDLTLDDMGLCAFDTIEVVLLIEDRFNIADFEEALPERVTISELARAVKGRIG